MKNDATVGGKVLPFSGKVSGRFSGACTADNVAHLLTEGTQQGAQLKKSCVPIDISKKSNEFELIGGWLTQKEGAQLENIPLRTFQYRCKGDFYKKTRRVKGNGGERIEVHVECLSPGAIRKYLEAIGALEKPTALDLANRDEAFLQRSAISLSNQDKALNRYRVLSAYVKDLAGLEYGGIVERKLDFCRRYNDGLMFEFDDLRGEIRHLTFQTLDSWKKMVDAAAGDTFALAPGYGKSRGKRSVTRLEADILNRCWLIPRKTMSQAVIDMHNELKRRGFSANASDATYFRYLKEFAQQNNPLKTVIRDGEKALNDKCSPSISRDYSLIEVGDILLADGHTLNFDVINPYTGRPFRPTIVVVTDFKTGMPLGWEIGSSENTQIISMAYYRAIMTLGFVPRQFYLDNGRAFKAKYFKQAKDWDKLPGLFERLKPYGYLDTLHAQPYHGQSKPIERFFGTLNDFEQRRPGYRGNSIATKPPRLQRNDKVAIGLHNKLTGGAVDTITDIHVALADWILNKYAVTPQSKGSSLQGRSPKEVYMDSIEVVRAAEGFADRIITPENLRFLMLAQAMKKSGKNGIWMFGRHYWNEGIYHYENGTPFVVRFDFADLERIYVFDESGETFLFEARTGEFEGMHPSAAKQGTEEQQSRLSGALETIAGLRKATIRQAKDFYAAVDAEEARALPMVVPQKKRLVAAKKAVGCESPVIDGVDDLDRILQEIEDDRMQAAEERRRRETEEDERLSRLMYD